MFGSGIASFDWFVIEEQMLRCLALVSVTDDKAAPNMAPDLAHIYLRYLPHVTSVEGEMK